MTLSHAIALILLIEAVALLAVVCGWLWWRLRQSGAAAAPEPGEQRLRELVEAEIAHNAQRLQELPEDEAGGDVALRRALNMRTRALETERRLLALTDAAARDDCLRRAHGDPNQSESEVERLRRLLHREEQRVSELLGLRDAIRELKLRFERLARLAEQLTDPDLDGDARAAVVNEYGEAAGTYSEHFESVANQLEELAGDLDQQPEPAAARPADTDNLQAVIGQQAQTIARLRDRVSGDGDAGEELDRLGHQMAELETCVQVLQDENDYLYRRLRALETAGDGGEGDLARQVAELEQALAMKEKEVEEMRGAGQASA